MNSKKHKIHAAGFACGLALALAGVPVHAQAQAQAGPQTPPPTQDAAPAPPAAEAPAAPQTGVRFDRGVYKPGIERLRVVRRENTVGHLAGQVALNVAFAVLAGGAAVQGFSKDDLGGDTLDALQDDPLAADLALNPAVAACTEALAATPEKRW